MCIRDSPYRAAALPERNCRAVRQGRQHRVRGFHSHRLRKEKGAHGTVHGERTVSYTHLDVYKRQVQDREGKQWRIMSDGSIRAEWNDDGHYRRTTDPEYRVEMVTPKLTYDEMEKFQECVRRIRPVSYTHLEKVNAATLIFTIAPATGNS